MDIIDTLHTQKRLRDIDYTLTTMLAQTYGEENTDAILAAGLTSNADASGHTCLDLASLAGKPWPQDSEEVQKSETARILLPAIDAWLPSIRKSPLWDMAGATDTGTRPFVLAGTLAYLRRFYRYEQRVAQKLEQLAQAECGQLTADNQKAIIEIFPESNLGYADQRKAAGIALTKRLLLLTGGPGTGKTSALARLLYLIQVQAGSQALEIKLAAPTGKAAMRMRDSLSETKNKSYTPDNLDEAATLHRLLGTIPNSPYFRHDAKTPLTADIVIIDEASMIALPMMAKLLDALKPGARLILLGDKNQLSSVEPGFVLGDICSAAQNPTSSLYGTLVELKHSYRFAADGPVGRLSTALQTAGSEDDPDGDKAWQLAVELSQNAMTTSGNEKLTLNNDVKTLLPLLKSPAKQHKQHGTVATSSTQTAEPLQRSIRAGYAAFLKASTVDSAFTALSQFRVLCALRSGPYGVENINKLTESVLSRAPEKAPVTIPTVKSEVMIAPSLDLKESPDNTRLKPAETFYDHRVVMVTRNNYGMNLFNGDIGIILPVDADQPIQDPAHRKHLVCWFENSSAEKSGKKFRPVACNLLPEHETAFAMTIHKSQGSQFTNVLMLLPPDDNPVLTKELIYTGITRVEKNIELWCEEDIFKKAATRPTTRASGLFKSTRLAVD